MKIEMKDKSVNIDGVEYVEAGTVSTPAQSLDGMPYVVIRSRDAGCHAGYLKKDNETSVELVKSRRLWYWSGAASLSQLAMEGVSKPGDCKFACEVDEIKIINHCEIIKATEAARKSIQGVSEWKR